jgi:hypothetical protein
MNTKIQLVFSQNVKDIYQNVKDLQLHHKTGYAKENPML